MKGRDVDPRRLDVEAFAKGAGELAAEWPLTDFERLAESTHPEEPPPAGATVQWRIRGESRPVRGGPPQIWLHLSAHTALPLQCQRCLRPVPFTVDAERSFQFVRGEEQAAELDADAEDDVLALPRSLDLLPLLEDELLLSLPLVPRHDACPVSLPASVGEEDVAAVPADNPFAALAALRRPGGGH